MMWSEAGACGRPVLIAKFGGRRERADVGDAQASE
jgi:hypothetical protein